MSPAMALSDSIFPTLSFIAFLCLVVGLIIHGVHSKSVESDRSYERSRQQYDQSQVDAALRGATLDLARRKAGLEPLGFENTPPVAKFLRHAAQVASPAPVATTPASPAVVVAAVPQPEPIPVGEVLSEDTLLPTPETTVLIPERILSVPLAEGVNGVIGFYAGESVAVRSIHVADPAKFGLPVSDYSAGQSVLDGRTDEQLLADAIALFPGVFLKIVTDPATEQALRIRTA